MNMQGIIFVLSLVILEVLVILLKKTEKKINIISFILVTIILNICYNAFLCYILTFFNIPNKLYLLSGINFIISIGIFIKIFKNKVNKKNEKKLNIQKYTIDKIDLFAGVVLLILTITVSIIDFKIFNVNYETGDPATHYYTSLKFMQEEKLLVDTKDEVYGNFETRKFASYVNSGLIMKCFEGKIDFIDNYIIFISFSSFILFLTGYLIYIILIRFSKNDKTKILALIVSSLCILGYPLNSMLFGFEYMSLALCIMLAIIETIYLFTKDELKLSYNIIILFLLNFGLFCSYYMFIPFLYSAEWIYFCIISYKKERKIFTKNNILILSITLLLPFLLGFIYHFEPQFYQILYHNINEENLMKIPKNLLGSGFNTFGYIYTNLYSNFILLIPLALYVVIKKFKENKLLCLIFIFNILYIVVLLIGRAFDKVSYYYLSKNYFTLWIIIFILNFRALMYIYEKRKRVPFVIIGIYIALLAMYVITIPTHMENEPVSTRENSITIMDIYGANKDIILNSSTEYTYREIKLLKYIMNNYDLENDYLIVGNLEWGYSFTQHIESNENTKNRHGQNRFDATCWEYDNLIDSSKYIIYFNRTANYKLHKEKVFENAKVIYSNDVGGLVEKQK